MNKWNITITRVTNGYRLNWHDTELVVEDIETHDDETLNKLITFKKVLWELTDYFAMYGSDHSYKLHIDIHDYNTGDTKLTNY
jgi:hypothetical protein